MIDYIKNLIGDNILFSQSIFLFGYDILEETDNIYLYFIFAFSIIFIMDFLYYIFGIVIGGIPYLDRIIYNNKNLFYIYFRFIPILGNFGTFIGAFLSDKINFKEDLKKILIGNIFFVIGAFIFTFMGEKYGKGKK